MKCLILGDLHLGKGMSLGKPAELDKLNSRIQDQINLLNWAKDYCLKKDIKTIILTGDVYDDTRPHPAVIAIFTRWIKQCVDAGVALHICMGNHEIIRSGQFIVTAVDIKGEDYLDLATVHKDFGRIELDDFTIIIMPYRDKRMYDVDNKEEALKKFEEELSKVTKDLSSKTRIGVGHFALEGSIPIGDEISDQLNELFVPIDSLSWFDYVWMGHIHNPQVISDTNPYAAHVGSLDRSDFHKTEVNNDKIAIILDSDNEDKFEIVKIPTRPLRPVKIRVPPGKESTEYVINELCLLAKKLVFKDAIVKVEIHLESAELENVDREKIESYLYNNLEIHYLSGFSESRNVSIIQINPEDVFDNTMEISYSINKWAETRDHFESDEQRELFKSAAHEVRKEYEEKYLK